MFWKERQNLQLEMASNRDIRPLETSGKFKVTEENQVNEIKATQEKEQTVSFIQLVSIFKATFITQHRPFLNLVRISALT